MGQAYTHTLEHFKQSCEAAIILSTLLIKKLKFGQLPKIVKAAYTYFIVSTRYNKLTLNCIYYLKCVSVYIHGTTITIIITLSITFKSIVYIFQNGINKIIPHIFFTLWPLPLDIISFEIHPCYVNQYFLSFYCLGNSTICLSVQILVNICVVSSF